MTKIKIEKPDTHIYHEYLNAGNIATGQHESVNSKSIELFEKSLVMTSKIDKLPHLLGGKIQGFTDMSIHTDLLASSLAGVDIAGVLLNGDYTGIFGLNDDYALDLMEIPRRKRDILLVSHLKVFQSGAGWAIYHDVGDSWDFEGEVILYDTITLLCFAETDGNASGTALASFAHVECTLEIDWKHISEEDFKDYIMESVYARQGDN